MLDPVLKNPWVRAVGVLLALGLLVFLVYILRPVLIPLFLAFLVAYVLDPVVDQFEARKISRGKAIAVLGALGAVVFVTFPFILGASVFNQATTMINTARGHQTQPVSAYCRNCAQYTPAADATYLEDGTIECPNCHKPIFEVIVECNKCGQTNPTALYEVNDKGDKISTIAEDGTIACKDCGNRVPVKRSRGWLDAIADRLPLDDFVHAMGWVDAEGNVIRAEPFYIPKVTEESAALTLTDAAQAPGGETGVPAIPPPAIPGAAPAPNPDGVASVPADKSDQTGELASTPEVAPLPEETPEIDALAVIAEKTAEAIRNNALQFFQSNARALASAGQQAGLTVTGFIAYLGNSLMQTILFIANFALFAFVAGYLLKDFDRIVAATRDLLPRKHATKVADIASQIDDQLRSFLRGQMTVALCLGAMYFLGFFLSGVPFAFLIALFGIVASFIPFVGVTMVAIIALVLTLMTHQLDWHLAGVLITVGLAQFLEGNVLTPKIVGDKVGLNPVWVILAVMVFGNFLGFLGLLLAVPIAASLKVLVVEAVKYYKTSPVFAGVGSDDSSSGDST
ncbi:MAG: hypothetical protein AMXMBFR84_39960 [Candidatus Hydrogenedentota bacterium]